MTLRVGINGFGRTGRQAFRAWFENRRGDFEIVAINRGPVALRTHLLRYDSDYGRFPAEIVDGTDSFTVDGHEVAVFNASTPSAIPWGSADVDVVLECTGEFRDAKTAGEHLRDSVRKVVISAPAKGEDWTVIMGANDEQYDAKAHRIISAGSCTTNCVVLAVKVLHDSFGVERGMMSTIHSYTGDQNLVDGTHKDLRRARAAALNIVPTSSGASDAVGRIIPSLAGKFDGFAFRVPTPTVSLLDLVTTLRDAPSEGAINEAFMAAASGPLKGYLYYEKDPLVSMDFKGHPGSAIHDAESTMVLDGGMAKTVAWYDNEWGYSCRLTDVVALIAERGLE
ncbi:MAG: type I glyceraldehyde-3-phosphate dehydrogenase [Dehalococcoidia bacterium]